jgi:circadian clock protein KaiB
MDEPKMKELEEMEEALNERETDHYVLRLYVAGLNRISLRAIENLKKICEANLRGRYELEVIDIYQQPVLAQGEQIIAAPTSSKSCRCRSAGSSAICPRPRGFWWGWI